MQPEYYENLQIKMAKLLQILAGYNTMMVNVWYRVFRHKTEYLKTFFF